MSAGTSIEWTDVTWNPVRGCSRVSAGCQRCYAERMAARNLPGMRSPTTGKPFAVRTAAGPRWTGAVELIPSKLDEPLHWRRPRRVFVNSMSDLFHEALPDMAIAAVFAVMETAQRHTFQILTKRPERMLRLLSHPQFYAGLVRKAGYDVVGPQVYNPRNPGWPLPNVWLGVSCEDQATADDRIPLLLQTPAAKRFVSYEPGLGGIDFGAWLPVHRDGWQIATCAGDHIDWVIVGGESGPGARPFDLAWARSTVAQCKAAGVAAFVKQMGSRPVSSDLRDWIGHRLDIRSTGNGLETKQHLHYRDRKGGDMAEWSDDLRVREFPA